MADIVDVVVKLANGEKDVVLPSVSLSSTVFAVKQQLQILLPSHPTTLQQKLVYNGRLLSDDIVLKDTVRPTDPSESSPIIMHLALSAEHHSPSPSSSAHTPAPAQSTPTPAAAAAAGSATRSTPAPAAFSAAAASTPASATAAMARAAHETLRNRFATAAASTPYMTAAAAAAAAAAASASPFSAAATAAAAATSSPFAAMAGMHTPVAHAFAAPQFRSPYAATSPAAMTPQQYAQMLQVYAQYYGQQMMGDAAAMNANNNAHAMWGNLASLPMQQQQLLLQQASQQLQALEQEDALIRMMLQEVDSRQERLARLLEEQERQLFPDGDEHNRDVQNDQVAPDVPAPAAPNRFFAAVVLIFKLGLVLLLFGQNATPARLAMFALVVLLVFLFQSGIVRFGQRNAGAAAVPPAGAADAQNDQQQQQQQEQAAEEEEEPPRTLFGELKNIVVSFVVSIFPSGPGPEEVLAD